MEDSNKWRGGSWEEYRISVLEQLHELSRKHDALKEDIDELRLKPSFSGDEYSLIGRLLYDWNDVKAKLVELEKTVKEIMDERTHRQRVRSAVRATLIGLSGAAVAIAAFGESALRIWATIKAWVGVP